MLQSFLGGLMIGAAALLLYASAGRIAGISGIAYGALWPSADSRGWRLHFLLGMVGGGWLALLAGAAMPTSPLPDSAGGIALLLVAGLLVGLGTRLGNGCTSGHGVCGLARWSRRSLAATLGFMAMGMASASLLRPLLVGVLS